jgi:hypothetical protein
MAALNPDARQGLEKQILGAGADRHRHRRRPRANRGIARIGQVVGQFDQARQLHSARVEEVGQGGQLSQDPDHRLDQRGGGVSLGMNLLVCAGKAGGTGPVLVWQAENGTLLSFGLVL